MSGIVPITCAFLLGCSQPVAVSAWTVPPPFATISPCAATLRVLLAARTPRRRRGHCNALSVGERYEGSPSVADAVTEEMENLQNQLHYIEALEERNKAQLMSFVDEKDQWDSMEQDERDLMSKKDILANRLEKLTEELVGMWMGGKSVEG